MRITTNGGSTAEVHTDRFISLAIQRRNIPTAHHFWKRGRSARRQRIQRMKTVLTITMTGFALIGLAACSQSPEDNNSRTATNDASAASAPAGSPVRIRGTLQTVKPDAVGLQTYDGKTVTVSLDDKTQFAWVVPSSLSTLKNGDFVGTATKGEGTATTALEVVIFPESMRGNGEGHYPWEMPAAVANADGNGSAGASAMTNGTVVQGSMTNGTVQKNGMTNGTALEGGMTNGTVKTGAGAATADGQTHLTISYKGGTAEVLVPKNAPIVRFEPTQKAMLAAGQKLFVVAAPGDTPTAKFVAMGKDGLMPPM